MDNQSPELSPGTPSSPSTELKDDFMSSYTQIESSTYEQSQLTELSSSSDNDEAPEIQDEVCDTENKLPELTSQIMEWSKERFQSYEDDSICSSSKDGEEEICSKNILTNLEQLKELEKTKLKFVNPQILDDLESCSIRLANNVGQIMGFIKMTSSEITKNSVKSIQTFQDTQNDLAENVDSNIKLMYRLIAQCEELDESLKFSEDLAKKM